MHYIPDLKLQEKASASLYKFPEGRGAGEPPPPKEGPDGLIVWAYNFITSCYASKYKKDSALYIEFYWITFCLPF